MITMQPKVDASGAITWLEDSVAAMPAPVAAAATAAIDAVPVVVATEAPKHPFPAEVLHRALP